MPTGSRRSAFVLYAPVAMMAWLGPKDETGTLAKNVVDDAMVRNPAHHCHRSGTHPVPLPDFHQAELDEATLRQLFDDIRTHAAQNLALLGYFLREAPERVIGSDRRARKWGLLVPATQQMIADMMKTSSVPATANDVMSIAMTGGAIGGVLISCFCPIVTLVILN